MTDSEMQAQFNARVQNLNENAKICLNNLLKHLKCDSYIQYYTKTKNLSQKPLDGSRCGCIN